jgi:hypothetical protein
MVVRRVHFQFGRTMVMGGFAVIFRRNLNILMLILLIIGTQIGVL